MHIIKFFCFYTKSKLFLQENGAKQENKLAVTVAFVTAAFVVPCAVVLLSQLLIIGPVTAA